MTASGGGQRVFAEVISEGPCNGGFALITTCALCDQKCPSKRELWMQAEGSVLAEAGSSGAGFEGGVQVKGYKKCYTRSRKRQGTDSSREPLSDHDTVSTWIPAQ